MKANGNDKVIEDSIRLAKDFHALILLKSVFEPLK